MFVMFPNRCVCCGEVLPYVRKDHGVCKECGKKVQVVKGATCHCCGKVLKNPLAYICGDCSKKHHDFDAGKALFVYTGPMKLAMYGFKYSNARYMARFFAKVAAQKYGDWLRGISPDAIIGVPMYERKRRRRGYNQAEVFGKALGKELRLPFLKNLVSRNKNTVPQKGLTFDERRENLKNAFKIRENVVKLNCVLIVDDIYTTGATIDEVSRALRKCGVEQIFFLTICIGIDL